jgi:hypothetical protein
MSTPVIFRKWKPRREFDEEGGDIIALFPTIPSDSDNYYNVLSYQHIGQHGGASPDIVSDTVPATPSEYAGLLKELHSVGYRSLNVVSKFTYEYQKERERVWRQQRGERVAPRAKKPTAKRKSNKRLSSTPTSIRGMR